MMEIKEKLRKLVDEDVFQRYFEDAIFLDDSILLADKFRADRVRKNYAQELTSAFGVEPKFGFQEQKKMAENPKKKKSGVIEFPFWPVQKRFAPNVLLRSAVFTATHNKRRYLDSEVIGQQHGYNVKFTGATLDQADFDVWLQAAQIAKDSPLGTVCTIKAYDFLKSIGRKPSGGGPIYEWLTKSIARLQSSVVHVPIGPNTWKRINLIVETEGNDETKEIEICFSPNIIKLFAANDWTALQWEERKALKGKPLALWLHGYYSSHAKPLPIKIETLLKLSGSETKEIKHFKAALKRAFKALEKVAGFKARFEKDLVHVERCPSPTQAKFLKKKKKPNKRK